MLIADLFAVKFHISATSRTCCLGETYTVLIKLLNLRIKLVYCADLLLRGYHDPLPLQRSYVEPPVVLP